MSALAEKVSVSLPADVVNFVESYRKQHDIRSRSQVFELALKLLRERELERAYAEASKEHAEIARDFAVTDADGLPDEAW